VGSDRKDQEIPISWFNFPILFHAAYPYDSAVVK
jgi:hypothetical protein